jgi:hypothetical protein
VPAKHTPYCVDTDGDIDGDPVKPSLVEKPKLAIVPFRHSKITELFQDFFIGEGRAVSQHYSFIARQKMTLYCTGDDHQYQPL